MRPASSRACTSACQTAPSRVPLAITSCRVRSSLRSSAARSDQTVGTKPSSGGGAAPAALWGLAGLPNRRVSVASQASASSRASCRRAATPLAGSASAA